MKNLNTLLKESSFKFIAFEKALNLKKTSFYNLRIGKRKIKPKEAVIIAEMLNIPAVEVVESWRAIKSNNMKVGA